MVRTKKAAKIAAKNKKYKKLPLDSIPWEVLSKNIKGKFKSKIKTEEEYKNESLVSDDRVNIETSFEANHIKVEHDHESNLRDICVKNSSAKNKDCESLSSTAQEFVQLSKKQKRKLKKQRKRMSDLSYLNSTQKSGTSFHSETVKNLSTENNDCDKIKIKVEHDSENNPRDVYDKNSSTKNNDCESLNANSQKLLPDVKKLSNSQKKKLKRQKKKMSDVSSPILTEKSDTPIQSETKKLSRFKLKKNKLFEKKRLERRKELGIMLLPKNIENRLSRLRKALRKKNLPAEEIKTIMRKKRSNAQDEFRKSNSSQICFNCRKPGHLVASCPLNEDCKDASICLKCGSTEHKYSTCQKNIAGFPFATCFICKGQGHISRDCPNNEHGIYPKGGKCNLCDSVNHLIKDCPTKLKNLKKESSITLYTIDNGTSIDDEVMETEQSTLKMKNEKPKIVTF